MNKYNILTTAVLIITLFFTSGCSILDGYLPDEVRVDYRNGKEGLDLILNTPKDIIIYDQDKPAPEIFEITLANKGAYDVEDSDISIYIEVPNAFLRNEEDKGTFTITSFNEYSDTNRDILYGKGPYSDKGEKHTFLFNMIPEIPPDQGITARMKVETCYSYNTIISETICINTERLENGEGCSKKSYTFPHGQGAPIGVSEIQIRDMYDADTNKISPQIQLTFTNYQGNIFSLPGNVENLCSSMEAINTLHVDAIHLGNLDLSCNIEDDTLTFSDTKTVLCTPEQNNAQETSLGYYDSPIYIELSYTYKEIEENKINIKREGFYS